MEWESEGIDISAGSLSVTRLPLQGTAEWKAIQKSELRQEYPRQKTPLSDAHNTITFIKHCVALML